MKKMHYIIVFVLSFIVSLLFSYNFFDTALRHIVAMIVLFFINYLFNTLGEDKKSPLIVFLISVLGVLIFLLPYALTHMPYQTILIGGIITYVLGCLAGYLFSIAKAKLWKIVVVICMVSYALLYNFLIVDMLKDSAINNML